MSSNEPDADPKSDPKTKKEVPTIDVEVISETKDTDPAPPIPETFETAAKVFDHAGEMVGKAVDAARAAGVSVEPGTDVGEAVEALQDTLETAADGIREAGALAGEAQTAGRKAYDQIEKLGAKLTEIRGGRGAFARRL